MIWNIYLSGEIHTDWRQKIKEGCAAHNLSVTFTSAVTDHEASDAAGDLLGAEENNFWRDHKSAKVNAIRIKTLIENCDIAVVRFGDKYKQLHHLLEHNSHPKLLSVNHQYMKYYNLDLLQMQLRSTTRKIADNGISCRLR